MFFKSLGKSLLWTCVFFAVGLLQISMIYFYKKLDIHGQFDLTEFFLDGFFIFLSISAITSVIYEFYFEADVTSAAFWNKTEKFFSVLIGIIFIALMLFTMSLYAYIYIKKPSEYKQDEVIYLEEWILGISAVFALILKLIIYYKEYLESGKK